MDWISGFIDLHVDLWYRWTKLWINAPACASLWSFVVCLFLRISALAWAFACHGRTADHESWWWSIAAPILELHGRPGAIDAHAPSRVRTQTHRFDGDRALTFIRSSIGPPWGPQVSTRSVFVPDMVPDWFKTHTHTMHAHACTLASYSSFFFSLVNTCSGTALPSPLSFCVFLK